MTNGNQLTLDSFDDLTPLVQSIFDDLQEHPYTEPMSQFATTLEESHAGFFQRSTDPTGQPWPPLSPVTIAKKGHATILVETTHMRESLKIGQPDNVIDFGSTGGGQVFLTFGTSDRKAGYHQFGTSRIPARPFVGVTEKQPTELAEMIADDAVRSMIQT